MMTQSGGFLVTLTMGNEASHSSFGGLDYTSASGLTQFANTTSFAVDKEVGTYSLCFGRV